MLAILAALIGTAEAVAEKLARVGVLKGRGFPAVPKVFKSAVRRG
jgi:hypothetical protein